MAHGVGYFYSWFCAIDHSGLQLYPFLGYGTALVFPSTNVNLSSKSGQCSKVAHGVGVFNSFSFYWLALDVASNKAITYCLFILDL